jgi:hypothetical protein
MLMNNQQFMQEGFGTNSITGGGTGPKRRARGGGGGAVGGKMGPPVVKSWMEKWRVQLKIAGVGNHLLLSSLGVDYRLLSVNSTASLKCLSSSTLTLWMLEPQKRSGFKSKSDCIGSITYEPSFHSFTHC